MSLGAPVDAYVRLPRAPQRATLYRTPTAPNALLFVDLNCSSADAARAVQRLRELPHGHYLGVTTVLVRLPIPDGSADADATTAALLDELARMFDDPDRLQTLVTRWGVLRGAVGAPVRVTWRDGAAVDDEPLLVRRARQVELASLLAVNHAIWRPGDYHFKLPNGHHIASFVRVADALSGPRDAEVLAWWLQPDLADRCGLVFDNRSLTPIGVAAQLLLERQGLLCGPVTLLEHYPEAQTDVERAVSDAALDGGGVVGVLSVSSFGRTRGRLLAALARAGQPRSRLHTLIDRTLEPAHHAPGDERDDRCSWVGFHNTDEVPQPASQCALCLTAARRRVVAIEPRFFDGMILPDPKLMMLNPMRAAAAAPLWTACELAGAVALEHPPAGESRARRSRVNGQRGNMGVFVGVDRLVASADFQDRLGEALAARLGRVKGPHEREQAGSALRGVDLIVVAAEDHGRVGFDRVLGIVRERLPDVDPACPIVRVDARASVDEWDGEACAAIRRSRRPLVLAVAAVTGYTLQRLLVGCQELLRAGGPRDPIAGLVLHVRTATIREWETLRNSYNQRLYAVFDTPLPSTSPLLDEEAVVQYALDARDRIPAGWREPVATFLDGRLALVEGSDEDITADRGASYRPLLWGMPADGTAPRARIRQHSLFGEDLGPAALLAAVGAAVHDKREQEAHASGPTWELFEVPALLRSYYDPLIIAAMLRWMSPGEMWWGDGDNAGWQAVAEAISRTSDPQDLPVLMAELLLAAAQGKVPEPAVEVVVAHALQTLESATELTDELVAVAAGLACWHTERDRRSAEGCGGLILPAAPPVRLPADTDGATSATTTRPTA
jgi:hypothetical protein